MKYKKMLKKVIIICALHFFTVNCWANFSNYNSILIGDRAAGMGGAGIGSYDDVSSLSWYNPAGLAKLKGESFSAAVGIYKKFDTRYKDDGDLTKASMRVNQGFFNALPSSTGSVIRPQQFDLLKGYTLALSILVPEYETYKGDIYREGNSLSTLSLQSESLWVGGSLAHMIDETSSWGMTVYYTARNVSKTVNDRTYVSSSQSIIFTEERNYTQNAVVASFGYHKEINDQWQWGVMYRLPSLSVDGKGSITQTSISSGTIQSLVTEDSLSTKARIPWKLGFGLNYDDLNKDKFAADINFYGGLSYNDVESSSAAEPMEHKSVTNLSVGWEREWRPWLKSRVGVFSNYSSFANPNINTSRGQTDHVDQAGFSANLAFRTKNIEYTFGGYYTGGRGQSVQRINQSYQVVPKVVNVFTMLVGTNYLF